MISYWFFYVLVSLPQGAKVCVAKICGSWQTYKKKITDETGESYSCI